MTGIGLQKDFHSPCKDLPIELNTCSLTPAACFARLSDTVPWPLNVTLTAKVLEKSQRLGYDNGNQVFEFDWHAFSLS